MADKLSYQSLSSKLTLAMTALVLVTVSGFTTWSIQRDKQRFQQELRTQATAILNTMVAASRTSFYHQDFDAVDYLLEELTDELADERILTSGRAYQSEGHLVSDAFVQDGAVYSIDPDPLGQQLIQQSGVWFQTEGDRLIAGQAVIVGNQSLGAISIGLSTIPLQEKTIATRNLGLFIAAIAIIIGTIIAHFLSRSIINPLNRLTAAIQQMTQGNLSQKLIVHKNNELAILADSFNQMSDRLSHSMTALEDRAEALQKSEAEASEKAIKLEQAFRDLHQAQGYLVQSEKMASLGQLVAGVAHEINNPVSFIAGNVQPAQEYANDLLELIRLYQQEYPHPSPALVTMSEDIDLEFIVDDFPRLLASMKVGTDRISTIIKSLRTFSRLDEAEYKFTNIHDGLDSTLMILHSRLREQPNRPEIAVLKDFNELPKVRCYPGPLNQVFMNIIVNAIDALDGYWLSQRRNNGSPFKDISRLESRLQKTNNPALMSVMLKEWRPEIQIQTCKTQENTVLIKISDNGPGIPDIISQKIFDPFFTTKKIGKGTGLGLSISYQIIVDQHKGAFSCHSEPGKGTTFSVEIPLQQRVSRPVA